ncbi:MAG: hypothetical protein ACE15C_16490 [Phycisphaerae bacterium]
MATADDVEKKAIAACNAVVAHTDTVLCLPTADTRDTPSRVGSCIFTSLEGVTVAITCAHVVRDTKAVWCGLPRIDKPVIPSQPAPQLAPAPIIDADDVLDLAILDARGVDLGLCRKKPYSLTLSDPITPDAMKRNFGTLSVICGTWGDKVEIYADSATQGLVEIPLYAAAGPIHDVRADLIVGDYAEVKVLSSNAAAFPQLGNVQLTGGSRWLGGTSGSGLWVTRAGEHLLAGILLGPLPGQANQQLIRFRPIWQLREWLNSVTTGSQWKEKTQ